MKAYLTLVFRYKKCIILGLQIAFVFYVTSKNYFKLIFKIFNLIKFLEPSRV